MYLSKFSREAVENRALRLKPICNQRRIYARFLNTEMSR